MSEDDQGDTQSSESYLEHFGLSDSPFQHDFAETFASSSASIKESLEQIANKCWYTVEPVLVSSEPFCEKNPLCPVFLKILGDDFAVCHINVDVMTTSETLLNDFAEKLSLDIDPDAFGPTLSQYFEATQDQGKEFAILVEGVHELSPDAFALLMDLVQAEAKVESNLHFVFWGQNSLITMVEAADTGDTKFTQIVLPEFTVEDVSAYLSACLAEVGYAGDIPLDLEAISTIYDEAAGNLVKVNAGLELALKNKAEQVVGAGISDSNSEGFLTDLDEGSLNEVETAAEEEPEVEFEFEADSADEEVELEIEEPGLELELDLAVEEIAETEAGDAEADIVAAAVDAPLASGDELDEEDEDEDEKRKPFSLVGKFPLRHGVAALVLLLILGLGYIGWGGGDNDLPVVSVKQPEASGVVVRSAEREVEPEIVVSQSEPVFEEATIDEPDVPVVALELESELKPEPEPEPEPVPVPKPEPEPEPVVVAAVEEEVVEPEEPVVVVPAPREQAVAAAPVTELERQHEMLLGVPDGHYFLQLMGTFSERSAQGFIEANGINDKFYYFETRYRNRPWFVVVYGDFPSKAEASAAKTNLPEAVLKAEPWARSMVDIRNSISQ